MSKYIISGKTTLELNEKNEIRPEDIEVALVAALDFEPQDAEGVTIGANKDERFWLLHQQDLPQDDAERNQVITALNQKTGALPLAPTLDNSFSQVLMRQLPMSVTSEAFVAGSLTGQGRVEKITRHNPCDVKVHGILAGKHPFPPGNWRWPVCVCVDPG